MKQYFVLVHQEARRNAQQAIETAADGSVVEIKEKTRTLAQNALLHTLIRKVSKTIEWAGAKRDEETWKRLLTAAWLRARGEAIEILPALDGHGVDIVFRRTSDLTIKETNELIEYIEAWSAENGIQ